MIQTQTILPGDPVRGHVSPSARTRNAVNTAVYHHHAVSTWRGVPMDKCSSDLLVYQEMIFAFVPKIIIETGSWYGGSALFLADMCLLAGAGRVISIDVEPAQPLPDHPLITWLRGDSATPEIAAFVEHWANGERGIVLLDSNHERAHVLAELDAYSELVEPGQYLIVEDTNINNHPVRPDFGSGPWEAVEEWLPEHPEFTIDPEAEPYVTFAPSGYLKRL